MEDYSASLDWSLLLPDLSNSASGAGAAGGDLSALIITVLVVVAAVGVGLLVHRLVRASRSIDFFLGLIEGLDAKSAAQRRYELLRAAGQLEHEGALWAKLDKGLVVAADGASARSSLDLRQIFNSRTVARNWIDYRVVAAASGILLLLGVLGTSVVLQREFAAPGAVPELVDGVAVAFATTVWGVLTSLLLQGLWHGSDWWIRIRLHRLRRRLRNLFPPMGKRAVVVSLDAPNGEQREGSHTNLESLVDAQLQAKFDGMADRVQARVWEATMPAVHKLEAAVEQLATQRPVAANGSSAGTHHEHLDHLVAQLTEAGDRLDSATASVSAELCQRVAACGELVDRQAADFGDRFLALERQQQAANDRAEQMVQKTLEGAEAIAAVAAQERQRATAGHELLEALDTARFNIENTVDELQQRAQRANENLDQLEVGYRAFLDGLSESAVESGARMSNLLIDYSQQLGEQTRERVETWDTMTQDFSKSMAKMLDDLRATLDKQPASKPASPRRKQAATTRRTRAAKKG